MNYDQAFAELIGTEGGYSNRNPVDDPGGETMWGITLRVAREWGYTGAMRDLAQDTAKSIAFAKYWTLAHCDDVPELVRFNLFDAAYNSGPTQAIKFLQEAAGTTADGLWGPNTQHAAMSADPHVLVRRFNSFRLDFLADLKNWPANSVGWARRIAKNLRSETT